MGKAGNTGTKQLMMSCKIRQEDIPDLQADQAYLDFDIVAAMEQPGWGEHPSAPVAGALQLVMLEESSEEEKQGVTNS